MLQLATGDVTETRASPPEILRCKAAEIGLGSKFFNDAPDQLLSDAVAPDCARPDRRSPQPTRIARIARSRLPRIVSTFVAPMSTFTCAAMSQLSSRFAPFTRRRPATNSGLRSAVSAASYASRRTAVSQAHLPDRRPTGRWALGQWCAVEQTNFIQAFHHQIVGANVVESADVRMIER